MMIELIPSTYLPLFIYFSRIMDVSLGTLRIMFVSKGMKAKATICGFFEVLIWVIVVAQIFQNLDNWLFYLAFAAGLQPERLSESLLRRKCRWVLRSSGLLCQKRVLNCLIN